MVKVQQRFMVDAISSTPVLIPFPCHEDKITLLQYFSAQLEIPLDVIMLQGS